MLEPDTKGTLRSRAATATPYEAALDEGRWVVVVDGVEGKEYEGLVKGASVVFDDNVHLHYLVVSGERILLVEEEIQPTSSEGGAAVARRRRLE